MIDDDLDSGSDDERTDVSSIEFSNDRDAPDIWHSWLDLLNRRRSLFDRGGTQGTNGDAQGVPVQLPNGDPVTDPSSKTGYLMGPTSDYLSKVAEAGQRLGADAIALLQDPEGPSGAFGYLVGGLAMNLAQGGVFDAQRERSSDGTYIQRREYRDLANVSVGLFAQQAGFSEQAVLSIAGAYAFFKSSNALGQQFTLDPRNFLDPKNALFTHFGYSLGQSGVFRQLPFAP
jgi:hypothetical protein